MAICLFKRWSWLTGTSVTDCPHLFILIKIALLIKLILRRFFFSEKRWILLTHGPPRLLRVLVFIKLMTTIQLALYTWPYFNEFFCHLIHRFPLALHVLDATFRRDLEHVKCFYETLDMRCKPLIDFYIWNDFAQALINLILSRVDVTQLIYVVAILGEYFGVEG